MKNYLGVAELHGTAFQKFARQQMEVFGALVEPRHVEAVKANEQGFSVTLDTGDVVSGRYLILSEGKSPRLAQQLGVAFDGSAAQTNRDGQTSVKPSTRSGGWRVRIAAKPSSAPVMEP